MRKLNPDRVIMFSVIGLVAWAIVALPLINWAQSQPKEVPAATSEQTSHAKPEEPWLTKDAAGFFTFGLVIIGALQLGLFYWQLRYMRVGMNDAKTAAEAARDAANAGTRQAKIAEETFSKLERPWVFVFGVSPATSDSETGEFFIEYSVANYGKLPAVIEFPTLGFVFNDAKGDPQSPIFPDESHSLVAAPILAAGETRRLREYFPADPSGEVAFQPITVEGEPTLRAIPSVEIGPGQQLYFRVVIAYSGPVSGDHETGANWLYLPNSLEFVPRGAATYNYNR